MRVGDFSYAFKALDPCTGTILPSCTTVVTNTTSSYATYTIDGTTFKITPITTLTISTVPFTGATAASSFSGPYWYRKSPETDAEFAADAERMLEEMSDAA